MFSASPVLQTFHTPTFMIVFHTPLHSRYTREHKSIDARWSQACGNCSALNRMVALDWLPLKASFYAFLNVSAATGIVFANKTVMSVYGFNFVGTLTLLHTFTTAAGLAAICQLGFFPAKAVSMLQVLPIAAAYVGYVILSNMSLKLNTLGFYQMSKICILPVLMVLEGALFSKVPSKVSSLAAVMVCFGMALATVTDQGLVTGTSGFLVGTAAIFVTAMYQIWAGSKQKELQIGSLQLLHQYAPVTALLLIFLVPVLEPVGLFDAQPSKATVLGYAYNRAVVLAMVASCFLGLLVSLSTLLLIGATSSLTFNMVGHVKTVIILLGGCLLFGDTLSYAQAAGVTVALAGVGLYSFDEFWKKKPDIEVAEKAGPVEVSLTKKV